MTRPRQQAARSRTDEIRDEHIAAAVRGVLQDAADARTIAAAITADRVNRGTGDDAAEIREAAALAVAVVQAGITDPDNPRVIALRDAVEQLDARDVRAALKEASVAMSQAEDWSALAQEAQHYGRDALAERRGYGTRAGDCSTDQARAPNQYERDALEHAAAERAAAAAELVDRSGSDHMGHKEDAEARRAAEEAEAAERAAEAAAADAAAADARAMSASSSAAAAEVEAAEAEAYVEKAQREAAEAAEEAAAAAADVAEKAAQRDQEAEASARADEDARRAQEAADQAVREAAAARACAAAADAAAAAAAADEAARNGSDDGNNRSSGDSRSDAA